MATVDGGSGGGRKKKKDSGSQVVIVDEALGTSTTVDASAPAKNLGTPKGAAKASKAAGSAKSGESSYDKYLRQQKAEAAKAKAKAAERYMTDAKNLEGQIAALRAALRPSGAFKDALKIRLKNNKTLEAQQLGALESAFGERWGSLDADAKNNEAAASDSSGLNERNRIRERANALSEAAAQGAGESDTLRTQQMSLRNWEANQGEINRAYYDSGRSIENSRIDLRADTRNALQNVASDAASKRAQLRDDYYAQISETQTALGNALGQQAEYYGLAKEQGASLSVSASAGSKGGRKGKNLGTSYVAGPGEPGSGWEEEAYVAGPGEPGSGWGRQPGRGGRARASASAKVRGGKGRRGRPNLQEQAANQSDEAFMEATRAIGRAGRSVGIPEELLGWGPEIPETPTLGNSVYLGSTQSPAMKRPEGATLRKW